MPLAMTVREHALMWVRSLGKLLNDSAKENLFSLRDLLVGKPSSFVLQILNFKNFDNVKLIFSSAR